MSYWMTQSLLNSWIYWQNVDDQYEEKAYASFLATLRREKEAPTKAMQTGIKFEDDINALVASGEIKPLPPDAGNWEKAVNRFARICCGGQSQVPVSGDISISGMELVLYGVCDYVKAGQIFDIKKVSSKYEYGKYYNSPQHPMYLHLIPEAKRFDYLIFNGTFCYRETYRRCDCKPIQQTISEFIPQKQEITQEWQDRFAPKVPPLVLAALETDPELLGQVMQAVQAKQVLAQLQQQSAPAGMPPAPATVQGGGPTADQFDLMGGGVGVMPQM